MIGLLKKITMLIVACYLPAGVCGASRKPIQWKIKQVEFSNNHVFSDKQLRRVIVSKPPTFLSSRTYRQEVFEDDLRNIVLFYNQNGYLEARVADFDVRMDTSRAHVRLDIDLEEGQKTRIEAVGVLGNRIFTDERLLSLINLISGDPFDRRRVERSTLALLRFYAENGYLEADVEPEARIDSVAHRAILDFRIHEGRQSIVGNIRLDGLEKTRSKVVLRELQFKSGDVLRYSRLMESQRRIYMTGLFQSAFVRPMTAEYGDTTRKDIRIELKENPSIELNFSAGYGSVERLRGKAEVFNKNVWGSARKVGLVLTMSFIHRGVEGSFTEPWTLGTPWQTDLVLGSEYREEPGYHLSQMGGRLTIGRTLLQRSNIMARFRLQKGKLSEVSVEEIPDDVRTDIRSLELILTYDSRDNLFNATRGLYAEWQGELGESFAQRINGFVRFSTRMKCFFSKNPKMVFASAVDIGWMRSQGGLPEIPLSERFYAGGPNSVRGFRYSRLGPLNEDRIPLGGQLKCVWHVIEIRRNLYKMFDAAVFLDMGNVWSDPRSFDVREFRFSPGLGIRLNTPIGVGRIDLGINVNPESGEPRYVWSLSMGQVI